MSDNKNSEWLIRSKIVDRDDVPTQESLFDFDVSEFDKLTRKEKVEKVCWGKPMHGKSKCLWYQCDDGWEDWCSYNWEERVSDNKARLVLAVKPARLLVLNTLEEVAEFHREFNSVEFLREHPETASLTFLGERGINWMKVMPEYDGIEMPTYNHGWSWETGGEWTYGWDCPFGCVWNAASAVHIIRVEEMNCPPPSRLLTKKIKTKRHIETT